MIKDFKLYRIRLMLDSPLIIGYTAPDHNIYKTLEYIPSITLRGGLATQLLDEFCVYRGNIDKYGKCKNCEQKSNCKFYQFFYINIFSISDALFLDKDCCKDPDLVPTHPLIKQCKRCKTFRKKNINYLKDWVSEKEHYLRSDCPDCGKKTTMDPLGGTYCKNCRTLKGSPNIDLTTSTAINYAKNSSLTKYLFNYSYIEQGSVFESRLFFESNKDISDLLKKIEYIRLGRSKSRGFGKISLKFEFLDLNENIQKNKKIIDEMINNFKSIIFAAKTYIFNLEISDIDNILVSNPLINIEEGLNFLNKKLELNLYKINNQITLKSTLGELNSFGGWSFKTDQPKPKITAAAPGSLYKFKVEDGLNPEIKEALPYFEFIGLNDYSRLGYNLIYFPSMEEK